MTSKKFHICIVMGESGDYEVGTDEYTALDRLKDGSGKDLAGTVCRIVRLDVTMSEPLGENGLGAAVDVVVPDDAGRTDIVGRE
ncbi:MAG: hypothetical protein WCD69_28610 [Xanthobacteraceae bacterium]